MSADLPVTLPPGWDQKRAFGDADIQASVDRALGAMPDDAHVAVVAVADLQCARLAAMARVGDGWSFMGYLDRQWTGELKAGAEARWWR